MTSAATTPTLPPGGAQRLRSATTKLAVVSVLPLVVMVVIAVGGLRLDVTALRAQQCAAASLAALGALAMLVGLLRTRSGAPHDVIEPATMRSAVVILTVAAVLAWLGVAVLWALAPTGDASETLMRAAVLSIPLGFTAWMATYVRRIPVRFAPR